MNNLKVGFARVDITPPFGIHMQGYYNERHADGTLDPLLASAIAFNDGEKTAVIYSLDIIGMSQKCADEARNIIAAAADIPYEAVFIACSHTHTGPVIENRRYSGDPEYNNVMFRKLADAAVIAIQDMVSAEIEIAHGEAKGISFVRRFRMKSGKTQTNPGVGNPEIDHPIGSPDESVQLVKIKREGKHEILLVNFQVHPDVIGGCKFSADYPGFVRRTIEGAVDDSYCVYFNGAQGDTNHINTDPNGFRTDKGYKHSRHMGYTIASSVLQIYSKTIPVDGSIVGFMQNNITVPINKGDPAYMPTALKFIESHESGKSNEIPHQGMEYTTVIAEAYRMRNVKDWADDFTLYLNAIKIGDIVITGIPGEPFTDIGRGVKDNSPYKATIVCCCANGCEGYYPMKSAYDEGGYEARSSPFIGGVAEKIVDGIVWMFDKL
ncbi:MAG: hypothetical protein FWF15_08510 [Oscillospiraceae bacterium]|nr:hypothetical protein [Oscillospiraceae bacterium]